MFYRKSKSKNKSRWPDLSSHGKNGIACISNDGDNRVYSIHKHLDLSLVTGCIRTSEDELTNSREVIKEPICSHEGQSHDSNILEQELEDLKSQITSLQENKQELETQMLLYKEQESMVGNLQRLVEEKDAEIESLTRKVECLDSENKLLKLLVAEHAALKAEMESERMKVKAAQRKIEKSWRKKKEAMVKLRQQLAVQKARETEIMRRESEMKKMIEGLHGEIDELKSGNSELMHDKIELMNQMDCVMESLTAEKEATKMAIEEASRMRIANAELSKQMEIYRNDRRADIEELIYLRWINACLKHELKKKHRPKEKNSTEHENGEKADPERGVDEKKCSGYDSDCSSTTATDMIDSSGDTDSKRTKTSKPKLIHKIKKWVNSNDRRKKVHDEDRCSAPADEALKVRSSRSYENVSSCGKLDYATDVMVLPRSRKFLVSTAMS
ncbi:protein CHUP1, chloroplastic-like [Nymphaea colorata]|nr:protein CHUP1, chloroplastic-like [Nymphaea colorata]